MLYLSYLLPLTVTVIWDRWNGEKMISIKDIAQECHVSAMTVSRALNNSKEISKETKDRILEICKIRGYRPNSAAKSLATNKSNMIGLIIPDIANQYYSYIIKGVGSFLDDIGYGIILCNSDRKKENELKYLNFLSEKRIDGLILIPVKPNAADYVDIANNIPLILVDNYVENLDVSFIGNDNYSGAKKIISHMISKGYKRIGVILGDSSSTASAERFKGYHDALKENYIDLVDDIIISSNSTFKDGFNLAGELIAKNVDSIFSINDTVAMGVLKYCYSNGINVPNDLGLAGYDDIEQSAMLPVPLTTVHQHKISLGKTAASILIDELTGKDIVKKKVILQPELVVRKSCGE